MDKTQCEIKESKLSQHASINLTHHRSHRLTTSLYVQAHPYIMGDVVSDTSIDHWKVVFS